jgi:hypothetical protein
MVGQSFSDIAREEMKNMADEHGVFKCSDMIDRLKARAGVTHSTASSTMWQWSDPTDQDGYRRRRIKSPRSSRFDPLERSMFKFPKKPERLISSARGHVPLEEAARQMQAKVAVQPRFTSYDIILAVMEASTSMANADGWMSKRQLVTRLNVTKGMPEGMIYRVLRDETRFSTRGQWVRVLAIQPKEMPRSPGRPIAKRDDEWPPVVNKNGPLYMDLHQARRAGVSRSAQLREAVIKIMKQLRDDGKPYVNMTSILLDGAKLGISPATSARKVNELVEDRIFLRGPGRYGLVSINPDWKGGLVGPEPEGLPGGVEPVSIPINGPGSMIDAREFTKPVNTEAVNDPHPEREAAEPAAKIIGQVGEDVATKQLTGTGLEEMVREEVMAAIRDIVRREVRRLLA